MSDNRPVPDCAACGKPLGLYYAECVSACPICHPKETP